MKYCLFPFKTVRFNTREVKVGPVGVGGQNPIRIQSMTTTPTHEALATAEQIMRLADAGCEIARVTVQGMKEAFSCEKIKSILIQKGYTIPLVADIHFFPKAALTVADFVDKVRINPGNYVDKRASFKVLEYDDESYQKELDRLEEKLLPLIEKCKKNKVSMRIGTNHGSLSDRVMNRFGDSPLGMVESALEYTRVCRKYDFHDIIFSMKASNTHVMIQAYRLLVAKMMELGWDYPLHLGVTEAGSSDDGRIKSAVGIGSLLLDGLGDTIRVSLTEDPWYEIDPCQRLVALAEKYQKVKPLAPFVEKSRHPFVYTKPTLPTKTLPVHPDGSVYLAIGEKELLSSSLTEDLGIIEEQGFKKTIASADALFLKESIEDPQALQRLEKLKEGGVGLFSEIQPELTTHPYIWIKEGQNLKEIELSDEVGIIFLTLSKDRIHFARSVYEWLKEQKCQAPLILHYLKQEGEKDQYCIEIGAEYGSLLCDGIGLGLFIETPRKLKDNRMLALNCLQAARLRSSKTEFISCPSCGRTLFDLQTVTKQVQEKTAHLPGVKIAIMGCIVNGPGEMADADFGYVGSKPGKIDLYVGKNCVERDIEHSQAVERLVDLLKEHGVWKEPKEKQLKENQYV